MKLTLSLYDSFTHNEVMEFFNIEIRHNLHYLGQNKNCGGETLVVTCSDNRPIILKSYCRPDEPYNRKFGVLACIQRLLDIMYPGYIIDGWRNTDNTTNTLVVGASNDPSLVKYAFLHGGNSNGA
jgi:hypothetical protein